MWCSSPPDPEQDETRSHEWQHDEYDDLLATGDAAAKATFLTCAMSWSDAHVPSRQSRAAPPWPSSDECAPLVKATVSKSIWGHALCQLEGGLGMGSKESARGSFAWTAPEAAWTVMVL